jgi:hypothetical protein
MATVAVFLALGGGAWAAATLPKDSVGAKQLQADAVRSGKVKDGSLKAKDFKSGQLPRGQRGRTGPTGLTGAKGDSGVPGHDGTARAYGRIELDGTLTRSKGIASVSHPTTGNFCITLAAGIDPATTIPIAVPDFNGDATNIGTDATWSMVEGGSGNSPHLTCPAGTLGVATMKRTITQDGTNVNHITSALTDEPFFIEVP